MNRPPPKMSNSKHRLWLLTLKNFSLGVDLELSVTPDNILEFWIRYREADKKEGDGNIDHKVFISEMQEVFHRSQAWDPSTANQVFNLIFGRFEYRKKANQINLYDFLISMAICARLSYEDKLQRRPASHSHNAAHRCG